MDKKQHQWGPGASDENPFPDGLKETQVSEVRRTIVDWSIEELWDCIDLCEDLLREKYEIEGPNPTTDLLLLALRHRASRLTD